MWVARTQGLSPTPQEAAMLWNRTTLAILCAAAVLSCDAADSVTGPSAGASPSLVPLPIETEFLPGVPVLDPFSHVWNDDAGVIESARGGGHWEVNTALRTFAFTAKTRADGTVQGQYQVNNRDVSGSKEHGTVTCLHVDGNQAWIGGVITHSSIPGREGLTRVFRVVDNGEGSGASPDQATILIGGGAVVSCHSRPIIPAENLEGGNIQVRDGA
jgi:hypothetical protein